MEEAAKRFARKILAAHLLALLVIIAAVSLAATQLYQRTREQVLGESIKRQELLAAAAARGIENYYDSILSNLDLIRRGDEDQAGRGDRTVRVPRAPMSIVPVLWHQLEGRVSNLFGLQRTNDRVLASFPLQRLQEAQQIARSHKEWLRSVEGPSISAFQRIAGVWGHLICVLAPAPAGSEGKIVLVAVVPMVEAERQFINELNREKSMTAALVDENCLVMATTRGPASAMGADLQRKIDDPNLAALVRGCLQPGSSQRRTIQIDQTISPTGRVIPPRLVTAQPFGVGERTGTTWVLLISSWLSDVDTIVSGVFQKAMLWAVLLIVAMTAVLVSTSTQMIRWRLRVERVRNELMAKELAQARRIQLAWLPQQRTWPGSVRVAAINEPASHISGDFYDWFELSDGRTVVTIGDVTGHGMSAAFLMATTQLLIRTTMLRVGDPGRCLEEVNRQLCSQIFNGQFVTVLIVVLDTEHGVMHLANAGHFPPLLGDGQEVRPVEMESQLVLGVRQAEAYLTRQVSLPPRFSLLLYTDGVVDAISPRGDRFGLERLIETVAGATDSPQSTVSAVIQAVRAYSGTHELKDDLTLVTVQGQMSGAKALTLPAGRE